MLNIFSTGRSLAGIYRELRQLRRMAESYFEAANIPLPKTPFERLKAKLTGPAPEPELPEQLSEEELAQKEVDRIVQDVAQGRDPGTDYRPWY